MAALINAWKLFLDRRKTTNYNNYLEHVKTMEGESDNKPTEQRPDTQTKTRLHVIGFLLKSDSQDESQYRRHLKELNDIQKQFEARTIPECWA